MVNNKVRKFISSLLITILLLSPFIYLETNKTDIHNATTYEIQEINGIGSVLSQRIVNYLANNPNADIDDLSSVKGIGKSKLKLLKEDFK